MTDIRIAYDCSAWGRDGLAQCADDLCDLGFWGIEASGELVKQYYDKIHVFQQMLAMRALRLAAMSDTVQPAGAPEEIERETAFGKMICEFLCMNRGSALVLNGGQRRPEGTSPDDLKRFAELCNQIGEYSNRLRVKTCILPRQGELIETRAEMEKVLELTDPSLVFLCPDTGHLAKLGENPPEIIRAHINRIGHIHFTDFAAPAADSAAQNAEPSFTELGKGSVNFPAIIEILHGANYKGIITIELDKTALPPKESAQISKAYVETVLGIGVHPRPIPVIVEPSPRPAQPEAAKPAEAPQAPEPAPVPEIPATEASVAPQAEPPAQTPAAPQTAPEAVITEAKEERPPEISAPAPPQEPPREEPPQPAQPAPPAAESGEEAAPEPAPEPDEKPPEERGFGYGILPDEDDTEP